MQGLERIMSEVRTNLRELEGLIRKWTENEDLFWKGWFLATDYRRVDEILQELAAHNVTLDRRVNYMTFQKVNKQTSTRDKTPAQKARRKVNFKAQVKSMDQEEEEASKTPQKGQNQAEDQRPKHISSILVVDGFNTGNAAPSSNARL